MLISRWWRFVLARSFLLYSICETAGSRAALKGKRESICLFPPVLIRPLLVWAPNDDDFRVIMQFGSEREGRGGPRPIWNAGIFFFLRYLQRLEE